MELNNRFKDVRKTLKMTQNEFSTELKISQGSVTDIERGKTVVTNKVSEKLFSLLKVSREWFYTGKGVMFSDIAKNLKYGLEQYRDTQDDLFPINDKHKPLDHISKDAKNKVAIRQLWKLEVYQARLKNNLYDLKGEFEGLYSNIQRFSTFLDLADLITEEYFDSLYDTIYDNKKHLTGLKFDYSEYKKNVIKELSRSKELNAPLNKLINAIDIFFDEVKNVQGIDKIVDGTDFAKEPK